MDIYLDNAATTKPLPELEALVAEYMRGGWYNPSSLYRPAALVHTALSESRKTLMEALHAAKGELLFTSGGTEANNTVVAGFAKRKRHFVTTEIEHPSVYEAMKSLMREGHEVDFIRPGANLTVDPAEVAAAVRADTALVSVMHVNNETGAVNDIAGIAAAVKKANSAAVFHSDGVQAFLKVPLVLEGSGVDFYTISAHKIHAFKGTGALYAANRALVKPLLLGGSQEGGFRAGTENTLGLMAFRAACILGTERFESHRAKMRALRDRLIAGLRSMDGVMVNAAPPEKSAPHIVNASFLGVRAETLLHALEEEGIYIGTGSACSSRKGTGSRVLKALGYEKERIEGAVRLSLSPLNTEEEIDTALVTMKSKYDVLKRFKRR
jgi:cysteine desulfurase